LPELSGLIRLVDYN